MRVQIVIQQYVECQPVELSVLNNHSSQCIMEKSTDIYNAKNNEINKNNGIKLMFMGPNLRKLS